jgi:hypothetical protein
MGYSRGKLFEEAKTLPRFIGLRSRERRGPVAKKC